MGCTLLIRSAGHGPYVGEPTLPTLDYDTEGAFNRGSLCGCGNLSLELCSHPRRFESPRMRDAAGVLQEVTWSKALDEIAARLGAIRRESGPGSVGLWLAPSLSNEDAERVARFARLLDVPNVDSGLPEDQALLGGIERAGVSVERVERIEQLAGATAMLCVGDVLTLAPCLAKPVLDARYDRRQNLLGTLAGARSRTTWFGKPDLRCAPGGETAALALMLHVALLGGHGRGVPWRQSALDGLDAIGIATLERAAALRRDAVASLVDALAERPGTAILIGVGFADRARPDLAAGLAAMLAAVTDSRLLAVPQGANAVGVRRALRAEGYPDRAGLTGPEMLEAALTGELRALLLFGLDPIAATPGHLARSALGRLDLLVAADVLPNRATHRADFVLPACVAGEKHGHFTNAFGADLELGVALRPPGEARTEAFLIGELERRMLGGAAIRRVPEPEQRPGALEQKSGGGLFADLDLFLRLQEREHTGREVGTHLLLGRADPAQSGDGSWTRHLSWPQHDTPRPEVSLAVEDAAELGVRTGDQVRLRSPGAEVVLAVRTEPRLPRHVVLAPGSEPGVRDLLRWRLDPALRQIALDPVRVSVERVDGGQP